MLHYPIEAYTCALGSLQVTPSPRCHADLVAGSPRKRKSGQDLCLVDFLGKVEV